MSYLIDTNVISEIRKGDRCHPAVAAWWSKVGDDEIYLSVLTTGEIRKGIENVRRRDPDAAAVLEGWLYRLLNDFADRVEGQTDQYWCGCVARFALDSEIDPPWLLPQRDTTIDVTADLELAPGGPSSRSPSRLVRSRRSLRFGETRRRSSSACACCSQARAASARIAAEA